MPEKVMREPREQMEEMSTEVLLIRTQSFLQGVAFSSALQQSTYLKNRLLDHAVALEIALRRMDKK